MGDIAADIKTYLLTKTAVTNLIGTGDNSRVWLHDAKEGVALPYIVISVFTGTSTEHLTAISGIASNRVQIDCYASTSSGAYSLAEVVRLAPLQMFRGAVGSSTVLTVSSTGGYWRGFDPPFMGSAQKRYFASRDYEVVYTEATS